MTDQTTTDTTTLRRQALEGLSYTIAARGAQLSDEDTREIYDRMLAAIDPHVHAGNIHGTPDDVAQAAAEAAIELLGGRRAQDPHPGNRVRLTYGDGSGCEGTCELVDGKPALRLDDGTLHEHVAGQVRRDIIRRAPDQDDATITIPRPHIPYGPKGIHADVADVDYLRKAAADLTFRIRPFGSNLRATVVKLISDSADAIAARTEPHQDEPSRWTRTGRRFPVGSPEPDDVRAVISEVNFIVFVRSEQVESRTWYAAKDSGGDGYGYTWGQMNGENAAEGGMPLTEVRRAGQDTGDQQS